MRVCIGGTFNILHKGHKVLIDRALEKAGDYGFLDIGIAVGEMIKTKKNVKSFDERKRSIDNYILLKRKNQTVKIIPIYDKFGLSVDEDYDAIVVSPETKKIAVEINKKRLMIKKKPLEIVQIPFVLAADGKPVSSSRIMRNEVSENGGII